MQRLFLLLVIVVVGAAVMAPVFIFLDLEPQPWDFVLEIAGGRPGYRRPIRCAQVWRWAFSIGS